MQDAIALRKKNAILFAPERKKKRIVPIFSFKLPYVYRHWKKLYNKNGRLLIAGSNVLRVFQMFIIN